MVIRNLQEKTIALVDLLSALRQRLIDDLEQDNKDDLEALHFTFTVLREVSYKIYDKPLITLLEDLEYTAQHGRMGVKGKYNVPSLEAIKSACES